MANCTATELRNWIGLKTTDIPDDNTLEFLRDQVEVRIAVEAFNASGINKYLKYLTLMLAGARVLRWLAQRAVKNGYITFNTAGGVSINKSPRELLETASQMEKEYNDFLCYIQNADATASQFLTPAGIDQNVVQTIKNIYQGVTNIWDFSAKYIPSRKRYYM